MFIPTKTKLIPSILISLLSYNAIAYSTYPGTQAYTKVSSVRHMMDLNTALIRNNENVWSRIKEGFQMDEVSPDLVRYYEQYYASRPQYFKRTLERGSKYLFYIINEVERRGMPTEIALLPVVESAFVATAKSSAGAAGLWQFMPATGRDYNLEQDDLYDGRRDVTEATQAALTYLQRLYQLFGDWSLALAAYNWGQGNVGRALARQQNNGIEANFETINLPKETRHYVPKLLAIRNLLKYPEKFGIQLDPLPNRPYFTKVALNQHIDLALAAHMADLPLSELKALNPAFNLPAYLHKEGRPLLLPKANARKFQTNLAQWKAPLLEPDVLFLALNKGQRPESSSSSPIMKVARNTQGVTENAKLTNYTVMKGDTLHNVAQRYQVSPDELKALNGLQSNLLKIGQQLAISVTSVAVPMLGKHLANTDVTKKTPQRQAKLEQKSRYYTVRKGDTLYSIAKRFGIDHTDLRLWNAMDKQSRLQPGERVRLQRL